MSLTKKCQDCGKRKWVDKFYFLALSCKDCIKIKMKARYQKEKIAKQIKKCEVVEVQPPNMPKEPNYPAIIMFVLLIVSVWVNLYLFFK